MIVPESLIDPIVIPVSSNELQVQWSEPATPNGIILLYQIFIRYLNNSQDDVVNSTSIGNYTESGLSPFTSYGFFVMVCNTAGCASSNIVYNTTLESGKYIVTSIIHINPAHRFIFISTILHLLCVFCY